MPVGAGVYGWPSQRLLCVVDRAVCTRVLTSPAQKEASVPGDVTRDEFDQVAARTGVLEREVEGEKLVTRHIFEQTRRNGDDIAEIKTDVKGLTRRVDSVDHKVDGL